MRKHPFSQIPGIEIESFSIKKSYFHKLEIGQNCQKWPNFKPVQAKFSLEYTLYWCNSHFDWNQAIFDQKWPPKFSINWSCERNHEVFIKNTVFFVSNLLKIDFFISESKRSAPTVYQMYRIYPSLYWMGIIWQILELILLPSVIYINSSEYHSWIIF